MIVNTSTEGSVLQTNNLMNKETSIFPVDGIKNLEQMLEKVRKDFPDVPFSEIKLQFGMCLWLSADVPKIKRRRKFKSEMR